jgi:hypothetical protein
MGRLYEGAKWHVEVVDYRSRDEGWRVMMWANDSIGQYTVAGWKTRAEAVAHAYELRRALRRKR